MRNRENPFKFGTIVEDGYFTDTMEEMIEHCSQFVGMYNQSTGRNLCQEEYKEILRGFFPMLKRWRD